MKTVEFEETHAAAVQAINDELKKQNGSNLKIGEIVDGEIGPTGRADYGAGVIAGLAEDPDLQCGREHLRQCWHAFRLERDHGARLQAEFPCLRFGHLFQISRLLGLEEEFGTDAATEAVFNMAKKAMVEGKRGKPMPADALARAVTTHIKSVKGRGLGGKPDAHESKEKGGAEQERKALEDAHTALSVSIGAIHEAAGRISGSGRYDHAARLQTDVDRIAEAYAAVLGHIVRHDPESLVIPMSRRRIIALAELVGLKLIDTDASERKEVLP
jgi:hypothetical protein